MTVRSSSARLALRLFQLSFHVTPHQGFFYDATWPKDILQALKYSVLKALGLSATSRIAANGRRLFISRKGYSQRRLVNDAEIEAFLRTRGFEIVSPEHLTFEEQVRLFHSASIIVGSCSSALTSALFCQAGTRLVGLINDQPEFNYGGYTSFLRAADAQIEFVRGRTILESHPHPYHRSYVVQLEQITGPLSRAEP